ncbi:ABC transporter permease subunit [uncultured Desulfuromusa sp.]|uniref:amino acid ABC transporter permease n=1 Tax=uncultured Desulfuromusa sp. TaxID=219183 RepID=UPI002AA83254|nr:ABC transporter permease subunit [uncultured Desulfuromusa sp.]
MGFDFKSSVMWESVPLLLIGVKWTILITIFGLMIGFFLGSISGLMKISRNVFLRKIAGIYIESIRGTPMMVQVMFIYFGLPMALGMRINPMVAGIFAIGLNSGAYIAEIVRGSFQSIERGQTEAGRSVGLSHFQTMYYIIWPQALKRMIPALGNQFIISLKDTSILVVVGVGELTRTGQEIIASNFRAFEVWITVALMYLVMTLSIAKVLNYFENKMDINT